MSAEAASSLPDVSQLIGQAMAALMREGSGSL